MSSTLHKNINHILAYLGLLPFLLCTLLLLLHIHTLPFLGDTAHTLTVYGLVIATFTAGTHWGQHLTLGPRWKMYLTITSNINAIFLWLSFLSFPFNYRLIALTLSFVYLLLIDKKLLASKLISRKYFRTRCIVTSLIIVCFTCLSLLTF